MEVAFVDRELTFKAVFLGVLMAIVLGAANAYLGMKAGLTVSATFPAAVVAMAALRPFRGTILEETVARTAAAVGEALVAGAIFTIPAFVIAGAWEELPFWESTLLMLIGGVLGVLFIIVLRRTLVVESDLPCPESVAAAEIHKAGQKGQTGAAFVFGAMGLGALWELFKNSNGIHFIADTTSRFLHFGRSTIRIAEEEISYRGGLHLAAPAVSPALMGIGFIVGARISAGVFAGAVTGWLVLVPLSLFLNPSLGVEMGSDLAAEVWLRQVRPLAVGTMIVAAFHTLFDLRSSLVSGIGKAMKNIASPAGTPPAPLMGGSNSPISGLTLSALLIAAVLMVAVGLTDIKGVAAVLGVAGVICCAAGIAGDMMQDLKVGHILGGTPWRMEVAEILGVIGASFVLTFPLMALHQVYGIGSPP